MIRNIVFSDIHLLQRMNAPDLILLLFSECGVTNEDQLCDYNRNFTNVNDDLPIAEAGSGVYNAMWQLTLAFIFKLVATIFTFGLMQRMKFVPVE